MRVTLEAKGRVAWSWHVAQEPDYVGSDHSSPTRQLHSLGSLLSSHLADEKCLHLYEGDVDSTYFSGLPCTSNESSHKQHLFTTVLAHGKHTTCFILLEHSHYTTSTKSEPRVPPKEAWALTAPSCLILQALPGHGCVFSGEGTVPWDQ